MIGLEGRHGLRGGRSGKTFHLADLFCGQRGEMALIEPCLLPQQSGGVLRPVGEPAPTVATSGAIALLEPL